MRFITLDENNKIIAIRTGSRPVNMELVSNNGEIGQLMLSDGSFIDDPNALIMDKEEKIIELSNKCRTTIYDGFKSGATGEVKFYTCNAEDQLNIIGSIMKGAIGKKIKYKSANELECYEWTSEQINKLGDDMDLHININKDKFYELRKKVMACDTLAEVNKINWE